MTLCECLDLCIMTMWHTDHTSMVWQLQQKSRDRCINPIGLLEMYLDNKSFQMINPLMHTVTRGVTSAQLVPEVYRSV